ncbi:MAG: ABC transporter transmembrane domain-containing protein [Bacilli bacterium]
MKRVFKILSKSLIPILTVIVLLFFQAMCDLALPDYTADIVNVGIQQGGIEDNVLEVMDAATRDNLLLFMNEDDQNIVKGSYSLISKNSLPKVEYKKYLKKYPKLADEDLYIINDLTTEEREKLADTTIYPFLMVSLMDSHNDKLMDYLPDDFKSMQDNLPEGMSILDVVKRLPQEKRMEIVETVKAKFADIEDSIVNQMGITLVKTKYEQLDINTERIQTSYIIEVGIKMVALAFLAMAIAILTTYMSSRIAAKFSRDLRSDVINKVMKFSNKEYDEISTASLITRCTNDIQQIQMLLVMMLRIVIYAPIMGIGALTKVSGNAMSWIIALAVLVIISVVIILFSIVMPKFKIVQKLIDKLNLVAREILTGLPVIRAFATEEYEEKRFDKANKDLTKLNLFVNRVMMGMMPIMMLVMNGVSILIVWVGASKVDAGTMQVGTLIAFITYTMQIIMSFLMISMMSIMLPRAWVSVKRVGEIFNKDISVKDKEETKDFDPKQKGVIEFKDVYFRYPDAEEDVLQNISFKAMPGTTTAFIGSTGSGKSTLINLIPRFFDVTGGKILVDGVNIKDVKLKDLKAKIGYVPQKGVLFSGTIATNIRLGNDNLSDDEMKKVSKIAQALDFIEEKEDGFDSPISQGGNNVSGGQKQRLAIARAIALDPDIYIFDDSFSALDYKTDALLRASLDKYTKNSTILIVAQRISTIMHADQIIVLDQGEMVGIGTHKELLKNCEVYREIAYSQLSKEELEDE